MTPKQKLIALWDRIDAEMPREASRAEVRRKFVEEVLKQPDLAAEFLADLGEQLYSRHAKKPH